jgi:hypothetical protein
LLHGRRSLESRLIDYPSLEIAGADTLRGSFWQIDDAAISVKTREFDHQVSTVGWSEKQTVNHVKRLLRRWSKLSWIDSVIPVKTGKRDRRPKFR